MSKTYCLSLTAKFKLVITSLNVTVAQSSGLKKSGILNISMTLKGKETDYTAVIFSPNDKLEGYPCLSLKVEVKNSFPTIFLIFCRTL